MTRATDQPAAATTGVAVPVDHALFPGTGRGLVGLVGYPVRFASVGFNDAELRSIFRYPEFRYVSSGVLSGGGSDRDQPGADTDTSDPDTGANLRLPTDTVATDLRRMGDGRRGMSDASADVHADPDPAELSDRTRHDVRMEGE